VPQPPDEELKNCEREAICSMDIIDNYEVGGFPSTVIEDPPDALKDRKGITWSRALSVFARGMSFVDLRKNLLQVSDSVRDFGSPPCSFEVGNTPPHH